jgi:hypothetical protein
MGGAEKIAYCAQQISEGEHVLGVVSLISNFELRQDFNLVYVWM